MDIYKKVASLAAAGCVILGMAGAALANQQVGVFVNGNAIVSDQPAYLEELSHVTFVPVRTVSEALGGRVTWHNDAQTITIERKGKVVQLQVNSSKVMVDGNAALLSAPVKLSQETGRSLVPLNFFSEYLDCQVKVSATAGVGILDEDHSDPKGN